MSLEYIIPPNPRPVTAVSGAQAMAETAVPGTVQVSHGSYALLHDGHLLTHRGRYYVPGLGETSTYLLLGRG